MASTKHRFRFLIVLLALVGLIATAVMLIPARAWLESTLKGMLIARGFSNVQFTLSSLGSNGLTLERLHLGDKAPLSLEQLTASYSPMGLLMGRVWNVSIKGLSVEALKEADTWVAAGVRLDSSGKAPSPFFPVTPFHLAGFMLDSAQLDDGRLLISTSPWQATVPLSLAWSKDPEPKLLATSSNLSLHVGGLRFKADNASADATLKINDKKWQGSWRISNISTEGMENPPPVMEGKGTLMATADSTVVEGHIQSPDQSWKLAFEETFWPGAPEKSHVRILESSMPWKDGVLSTRGFVVPQVPAPVDLTLDIKRVSAEALMQQITGKPSAATGMLSGFLPLTIGTDGSITVHNAKLEADGPGVIALPPDAIPGDNEHVAMLRDALANFQYTTLTADLNSSQDNRMVLHLQLEGRNPEVQAGRPFKVNVNLRGDVLSLVRQNIMLLINPLNLQETGTHAQ